MAKDKEKRIAFDYYTTQGMTAKAISGIINVNEKTIGKWVDDGNWKAVRDANINSDQHQQKNIKALISELTETQLEIMGDIKKAKIEGRKEDLEHLRKQSSAISQEVAIQTKALERVSDNKLSLSNYLLVMDDVFKSLQEYDRHLYQKTIDFQDTHLQTISLKLG
jgi:transposase